MIENTKSKYDHLRINVDELIPTLDDMRKYHALLEGMTKHLPYFVNDKEGVNTKVRNLLRELEGTDYEIENFTAMIGGFISYKALQIAKENINLEDIDNDKDWISGYTSNRTRNY